jgi:two-component system, LytTR family, sensor kinase
MPTARRTGAHEVASDGGASSALLPPAAWRWPTRAGVGAGFAVCTLAGLAFAAHWHALGPPTSWPALLRETMPPPFVWGALLPFVAWADRRLGAGRGMRTRVLLHVPLGLGWAAIALAAQVALRPVLGASRPASWLTFAAMRFPGELLTYAAIAGVLVARDYAAQARLREREAAALGVRAARLEAGLAEARLHALGSQLHPHFLFNALNTVSAYTERNPGTARRLMAQLGQLLRASLDHAVRPEVTLAEELAFLDAYLDIERARFEDRLTVTVRADERALDALIPVFLLQPLVENAIKHGITSRAAAGCVDVDARVRGGGSEPEHDQLVVRVRDDGVGLPAGWRLHEHGGVGLRNAAARLDALYPARHRFRVAPAPGGGVLVEVEVPFRLAGRDAVPAGSTALATPARERPSPAVRS